jgi:hypothetical protein
MFHRPLTLAYAEVNLTIVLKECYRLDETSFQLEEATSTRVHVTKESPQLFRFLESHFPSDSIVKASKVLPVLKRSIGPEALFAGHIPGLRML